MYNWVRCRSKASHPGLSAREREQLETIVRKGRASAQRQSRRGASYCWPTPTVLKEAADSYVARAVQTSTYRTVERAFCVEHGLERALNAKTLTGTTCVQARRQAEAQPIALSCGPAAVAAPAGRCARLADAPVELEIVEEICHETVRQT